MGGVGPAVQVHEYLGGALARADDRDRPSLRVRFDAAQIVVGMKDPCIAREGPEALGHVNGAADAHHEISGQSLMNFARPVA